MKKEMMKWEAKRKGKMSVLRKSRVSDAAGKLWRLLPIDSDYYFNLSINYNFWIYCNLRIFQIISFQYFLNPDAFHYHSGFFLSWFILGVRFVWLLGLLHPALYLGSLLLEPSNSLQFIVFAALASPQLFADLDLLVPFTVDRSIIPTSCLIIIIFPAFLAQ